MLDYFTSKKGKAKALAKVEQKDRKPSLPLLSPDDEAFLHHIETQDEGTPPPLPQRTQDLPIAGDTTNNNAQLVLHDHTQVPLPAVTPSEGLPTSEAKKNRWSFLKIDNKFRDRKHASDTLKDAVADSKAAEVSGTQVRAVDAGEVKKEQDEVERVLEQLNLAAINNNVFSVSDETRELLRK